MEKKFKVGDKVKILGKSTGRSWGDCRDSYPNNIGYVTGYEDDNIVIVWEVVDKDNGNFFLEKDLELIKEGEKEMEEKLTEKKAIEETIKIWEEIANAKDPSVKPIWAKEKYLNGCPLCDFTSMVCSKCPIKWPEDITSAGHSCEISYYGSWYSTVDIINKREAAIKIVKLARETLDGLKNTKVEEELKLNLSVKVNNIEYDTKRMNLRISTPGGKKVFVGGFEEDANFLTVALIEGGKKLKVSAHNRINTKTAKLVGMILEEKNEMNFDEVHSNYTCEKYTQEHPISGKAIFNTGGSCEKEFDVFVKKYGFYEEVGDFKDFISFAEKQSGWIEYLLRAYFIKEQELPLTALEIGVDGKTHYVTDGEIVVRCDGYNLFVVRMEKGKVVRLYRPYAVKSIPGLILDAEKRVIFK